MLVIGSGATAVTLVPAMTDQAAHVTMLQRTPTYVISLPSQDPIANGLRKILPDTWAYALTRKKNISVASHLALVSEISANCASLHPLDQPTAIAQGLSG